MPSTEMREPEKNNIYIIRGQKVMLDSDIASLCNISTGEINRRVKRNAKSFIEDFRFQLSLTEYQSLKAEFGDKATFKTSHGGRRSLPYVFTIHGAKLLANLLGTSRIAHINLSIREVFKDTSPEHLPERLVKVEEQQRKILDLLEEMNQKLSSKTVYPSISPTVSSKNLSTNLSLKYGDLDKKNIHPLTHQFIESILKGVSDYFSVNIEDLQARLRTQAVVFPRHIAMYLIRNHTDSSYEQIASYFGGKTHTAIIHGCQKIESALFQDNRLCNTIRDLQNFLWPVVAE